MSGQNRPTEQELLAFLEGSLDETDRARILDALDQDAELAVEVRQVARGMEALLDAVPGEGRSRPAGDAPPGQERTIPSPGVSRWWIAASVAATLMMAVPSTLWVAGTNRGAPEVPPVSGRPAAPRPTFVLVLHGTWPDASGLPAGETARRADEYWAWTSELARREVLLAAGDLSWEPGERLGSAGRPLPVGEVSAPDFVVGMFAVRAASYEEAEAIARECPHLRYGGSVSVRQVGQGFVTTGGFGDWAG